MGYDASYMGKFVGKAAVTTASIPGYHAQYKAVIICVKPIYALLEGVAVTSHPRTAYRAAYRVTADTIMVLL